MNPSRNKQTSNSAPPALLIRYRVIYGLCRCCWLVKTQLQIP